MKMSNKYRRNVKKSLYLQENSLQIVTDVL